MIIIQEPQLSPFSPCSYLPRCNWRFEYFFAFNVTGGELSSLLAAGWRKFGPYYFRPDCATCRACVPLRLLAGEFRPTKSQRRVRRKGEGIRMEIRELRFRDEIFDIYRDHSLHRFGREADEEEFNSTFYTPSCPGVQSEYYLDDELFAVGFLDMSSDALSSAYFIYRTGYLRLSPGIFSICSETEYAARAGLRYYYLGYHVRENHSMAYKDRFFPHETYDWGTGQWLRVGEKS